MGTYFAQNVPDLVLSNVSGPIKITVEVGNAIAADQVVLTPDNSGKITIPCQQFVRTIDTFAGPQEADCPLIPLVITGSTDAETIAFCRYFIIPGGIAKGHDTAELLKTGFLTWQPQQIDTTPGQPQWLALAKSPSHDNLDIVSQLTASNGRVYSKVIRPSIRSGNYIQLAVGFRDIWADFCAQNRLSPIAYDVFGVGTLKDGSAERPRPYPQRYILRPARYNDTCFGFANTLGGFDTFITTGKILLQPEGETQTFINRDKEVEQHNDFRSYWSISTGYIDSAGVAAVIQDFLKSRDRWMLDGGEWKRIIIDEYEVKHSALELNAYTFKYHLAEKEECRYISRHDLPEVNLPAHYFTHDDIKI